MKCGYCQLPARAHPFTHCQYRYRVVRHPVTQEIVGYQMLLKGEN